jgi:hypothetical protein
MQAMQLLQSANSNKKLMLPGKQRRPKYVTDMDETRVRGSQHIGSQLETDTRKISHRKLI